MNEGKCYFDDGTEYNPVYINTTKYQDSKRRIKIN